ncbi:MAG TPA: hypothetical protein VN956_16705 [Pyrinomonadaceae bacterium]|jgi:hypothetical protein|nr:hypothetical protein [Pyrinomonadaceae bacterium]
MQYPHWLTVAGACLVLVGFIGLAFRRNNASSLENNLKQAAPPNPLRLAGPKAKGK